MRKALSLFVVLFLCAGLIALSSCGNEKFRGEKKKINLKRPLEIIVMEMEHSLLNLPVYAAIEKGFFSDQGLIVRLESVVSREDADSALLNDLAHFLLAGPEMNIYLLQKGNKEPALQIAQISRYPGHFLVARDNSSPFQWKNLKGKVIIGYEEGDTPQLIFQYLMRKNNFHPFQDVHIVHNLPYDLRPGAFKGGSGHYLITSEPQASALELEKSGQVVNIPDNELLSFPTTTVIASGPYIAANMDACQGFVNALCLGLNWVHSNDPETLADVAVKYFAPEQEKAVLRAVSRLKTQGSWVESPVIDIEEIRSFQTIMHTNRELVKTISPELLVDNTFAEQALSSLKGKLRR